jgi:prepilin-type N-terminal cleavage/methylation domain-containing protein
MKQKENRCRGFTLIELSLVIAIFLILVGLTTVNLFQLQHANQLSATVSSFLADMKEQQIKAMVGDTEGSGTMANYGVHFDTTSYTLFRNAFETGNFTVTLPSGTQIASAFGTQILFQKGGGDISGFVNGNNTITFIDTGNNNQKVITLNRYGVVTSVD